MVSSWYKWKGVGNCFAKSRTCALVYGKSAIFGMADLSNSLTSKWYFWVQLSQKPPRTARNECANHGGVASAGFYYKCQHLKTEEFQIWMHFFHLHRTVTPCVKWTRALLVRDPFPGVCKHNLSLPCNGSVPIPDWIGTSLFGRSPTSWLLLLALLGWPKQINEAFHLSADDFSIAISSHS